MRKKGLRWMNVYDCGRLVGKCYLVNGKWHARAEIHPYGDWHMRTFPKWPVAYRWIMHVYHTCGLVDLES
jgi:hypothetical protein